MIFLCTSLLSLACSLPTLAPAVAVQDGPTAKETQEPEKERKSPLERLREKNRAKAQAKAPDLLRADGSVVKPGEIPAQASDASRASWEAVVDHLRGPKRIESFQLAFNLRQQSREKAQSNDLLIVFSYLAPRFLRAHLESGRELVRGPAGDYLIDAKDVIHLVGREAIEDIKQLNQMAAIAASFVGLTDPLTLRLVDLQLIEGPEVALPSRIKKKDLEGLTWMRVTSPDFCLFAGGEGRDPLEQRLYQADLGVHGESKAIQFAVIREVQVAGGAPAATMLVSMSEHLVRDNILVPHKIEVFELKSGVKPERFHSSPTSTLWLKRNRGRLGARLKPESFLPPAE